MEQKTDAKSRPNKFSFECDDLDFEAIHRAMAIRQKGIMPDNGSDVAGAAIAEICRGWMEALGVNIRSNPNDPQETPE